MKDMGNYIYVLKNLSSNKFRELEGFLKHVECSLSFGYVYFDRRIKKPEKYNLRLFYIEGVGPEGV